MPFPHKICRFPLVFVIALCQYIVMVCIYCGDKTHVSNSRTQRRTNYIWRRRICGDCGGIFTTIERPSLDGSVVIKKRNGEISNFVREILFLDIYKCCAHRSSAVTDAAAITDTIIGKLRNHISSASVERDDVIKTSASVLKNFDRAAEVQYLAYHPY